MGDRPRTRNEELTYEIWVLLLAPEREEPVLLLPLPLIEIIAHFTIGIGFRKYYKTLWLVRPRGYPSLPVALSELRGCRICKSLEIAWKPSLGPQDLHSRY